MKIKLSWDDFGDLCEELVRKIKDSGIKFNGVYGIPRGGLPLAVTLSHKLGIPLFGQLTPGCLIVDDIADTGETLSKFDLSTHRTCTLVYKPRSIHKPDFYALFYEDDNWIVFPWEKDDEKEVKDNQ